MLNSDALISRGKNYTRNTSLLAAFTNRVVNRFPRQSYQFLSNFVSICATLWRSEFTHRAANNWPAISFFEEKRVEYYQDLQEKCKTLNPFYKKVRKDVIIPAVKQSTSAIFDLRYLEFSQSAYSMNLKKYQAFLTPPIIQNRDSLTMGKLQIFCSDGFNCPASVGDNVKLEIEDSFFSPQRSKNFG